MPFTVTSIQDTPNPNARKFLLDRPISAQPLSFFSPDSAQNHPLASSLFQIPGVSSLLLLGDFITVNKSPQAKWPPIHRKVRQLLSRS